MQLKDIRWGPSYLNIYNRNKIGKHLNSSAASSFWQQYIPPPAWITANIKRNTLKPRQDQIQIVTPFWQLHFIFISFSIFPEVAGNLLMTDNTDLNSPSQKCDRHCKEDSDCVLAVYFTLLPDKLKIRRVRPGMVDTGRLHWADVPASRFFKITALLKFCVARTNSLCFNKEHFQNQILTLHSL